MQGKLAGIDKCDMPVSGSNFPPFSMISLNEESARFHEPSVSLFITLTSDCDTESLGVDMMTNGWGSVEVVWDFQRTAVGHTNPAERHSL